MSGLFTVPELAIGVGLSEAASAAFEPKVEVPKQSAWANNPQRLPDLGLIVELIAGGKVSMDDGKAMANRLGFSDGTTESLVWLSQDRLNFATMLRLWRRFGAFDAGADATLSDLLDQTIAHERLDWNYREWLRKLKTAELIGLGDIATAIVRSALPTPSWVPVGPPTEGTTIPRYPMVDLDPVKLAAAIGFDEDMLRIMTARSGLSLAPVMAANAFFRKIITRPDAHLAAAEGDLRTEWMDTLIEVSRQIPTTSQWVQGRLRGWRTADEMYAGSARHGTTKDDTDLIYQIERRPMNPHAITTALARGGKFQPEAGGLQDPYKASVHQADLGPEWYDLAIANRYTYPSAFVLRSLAQDGELGDVKAVEQVLLEIGWKPELASSVAAKWVPKGTAPDPWVKKAETQLWTATHKAYKGGTIDATAAEANFALIGIDPAAQPQVLALWDAERATGAAIAPAV